MASVSEPPRPIRLAHLAGVPATYHVPLYRRLAQDPRVDFTVIYASSEGIRPLDRGWYGQSLAWDSDLLSGYRSIFLGAADRTPGLGPHFWSARNWDIVTTLLRGRYDVLWLGGYNSATYLLAALTQRVSGRETLFREDQTLLDPRSLLNTVAKQLALRMLFSQGRALYTSSENRRWFQHFGVPDHRLFAAPHSVDNAEFREAARTLEGSKEDLRATFGIAQDAGPVILTVSRLAPTKQPLFLLEAFRRVRDHERCILLIVGSGPMEPFLRDEVRQQGLEDVVFAGFLNRSEISKAYAVADVFALLSRERETFGLVVSEAMNFGVPVIVSDRVGCASDLVSNDYNGFIVSSRDPSEAASAIERLVRDAELRARMGNASRERIVAWDVERTAAGIIAAAMDAVGAASSEAVTSA